MTDNIAKVQNPKTKLWSIINQTSGQILATGVDLDSALDKIIEYVCNEKSKCRDQDEYCDVCPLYQIEQILGLRD